MLKIEWKRGNPESLEGRVIVYTKLDKDKCIESLEKEGHKTEKIKAFFEQRENVFYAHYWTNSKKAFEVKKESLDEMSKAVFKTIEKVIELLDATYKNKKERSFFESPMILLSEEELLNGDEDVIFAGEYSSHLLCQRALNNVVDLYYLQFANELTVSKGKTQEQKEEVRQVKTHLDFFGESFKPYLQTDYVNALFSAHEKNDKKKIGKLKKELADFFDANNSTSPFRHAALKKNIKDLESLFSDYAKATDRVLKNLYTQKATLIIDKLDAVHLEQYKEAGKINKRLEELDTELKDYN